MTRGGLVPKLLHPNVVRGAANVASLRRLRYLVHGAVAMRRLSQDASADTSAKEGNAPDLEQSVRARNEMTKRLQRRRNTELGSLHNIAIRLNGRALAKKHDQGALAADSQRCPNLCGSWAGMFLSLPTCHPSLDGHQNNWCCVTCSGCLVEQCY